MSLKIEKPSGRKYWYITGTYQGQRIRQSTKQTDKARAEIVKNQYETEMFQRSVFGAKSVATFAEGVNVYLDGGGSNRFLLKILDHIGPTRLCDIDHNTLKNLRLLIYPKAQNSTVNRQLITPISAVIMAAHKVGLCDMRVFPKLPSNKKRLRWLTPKEADNLIEAAQGQGYLQYIIYMLLGSGMRTGEALSLLPKDLFLETGEAFLPYTKNGDSRMVEYPRKTLAALSTLETLEYPNEPLFRTPKGLPYVMRDSGGGQIQAAFNKARNAAGLGPDVTPHTLRHTWATWYYAATKDFIRLKELGGWRKPDTVFVYTKLAPKSLAQDLLKHGWDFTEQINAENENENIEENVPDAELTQENS